jgi:hypothetical protein
MKVKLTGVRLSFPDVFEAVQYENKGPFRYNATFLIEPGSDNDKAIQLAIKQVASEEYGKRTDANLAAWGAQPQKFCYLDGNTKEYEGYEDRMYLACHRKQKDGPPTLLDRDKSVLGIASGRPYAGCYVNASVEIYAQSGQNPGIRASFAGIQFVEDGDSFGGGAPASPDEFEDLGVPSAENALV